MLERERLESKKISKTNAVTSMLDYDLGADNVHVGPSDYVPWLTDRKWAYIRMEGTSFGDVPLNVELKLEVWDSPNSAGIVIDAVRLAKLGARQRRRRGARRAERLPDEVAAEAAPGRRGARRRRELHQEVRPQDGQGQSGRSGLVREARGGRCEPALATALHSVVVSLRICLVTPFSWSQPHDVNEHVAGIADALRERGHSVSVLAPSNRAADLAAGRRALRDGARGAADRARPGRADLAAKQDRPAGRRPREPGHSALPTESSTSSTASSPGCRASRTSLSGTRGH